MAKPVCKRCNEEGVEIVDMLGHKYISTDSDYSKCWKCKKDTDKMYYVEGFMMEAHFWCPGCFEPVRQARNEYNDYWKDK